MNRSATAPLPTKVGSKRQLGRRLLTATREPCCTMTAPYTTSPCALAASRTAAHAGATCFTSQTGKTSACTSATPANSSLRRPNVGVEPVTPATEE